MKLNGGQALIKSLEMEGVEVDVRPARRCHPARLRPDHRLARSATSWCATSRVPATWPRATPTPPAGPASPWSRAGRAPPTSSRRSPTPTWTRSRWCASPARSAPPSIGTDAFQEGDIIGITQSVTKHNELVTERGRHPDRSSARRSTSPPPAGPARCSSTSPRTSSTPTTRRRPWTGTGPPTTTSRPSCPATSPPPRATPLKIREAAELILPRRAPRPLRRRRHPQGPRRRGAARAGRADRHPGRHHADGPRCLPRRPPAVPRHARHARQLHGRHRDAAGPTC